MVSTGSRSARIWNELRVAPGTPANLAGRSTTWNGAEEFGDLSRKKLDATAKEILAQGVEELADAQELLWASDSRALLVVFQAIDAAGKDSTIKHVMSGVNPQGVQVVVVQEAVERGARPHVPVAHREGGPRARAASASSTGRSTRRSSRSRSTRSGSTQRLPPGPRTPSSGTTATTTSTRSSTTSPATASTVVKFFLHVSKAEQKRRFIARLDNPDKLWKFSAADVAERKLWDDYMQAYDAAITATSTEWAPWFVIPADHKHVMQAMVVRILVDDDHRARPALARRVRRRPRGTTARPGRARGGAGLSVSSRACARRRTSRSRRTP